MQKDTPYNPLSKTNLGVSVADALEICPLHSLPPSDQFVGAGVYAIYYSGDHPLYRWLVKKDRAQGRFPIYVGKAIPPGARKGNVGLDADPGTVLYKRLREHSDSILAVEGLSLESFRCRYIVVDDIWIPLGEALLIERYKPTSNMVIDGFGNHDPGKGRYDQKRSAWDVLHPGRAWTEKCKPHEKSEAELRKLVRNHEEATK